MYQFVQDQVTFENFHSYSEPDELGKSTVKYLVEDVKGIFRIMVIGMHQSKDYHFKHGKQTKDSSSGEKFSTFITTIFFDV